MPAFSHKRKIMTILPVIFFIPSLFESCQSENLFTLQFLKKAYDSLLDLHRMDHDSDKMSIESNCQD